MIGRLTKDVELSATTSGKKAISTFLAINNGKDENGNDRPADFPKVMAWNKVAENTAKYCKKGSQIAVEGRVKTRSWTKDDGTKGYETYIAADSIQFLDSKKSEGNSIPEPDTKNDLESMSDSQVLQKAMSEEEDPFTEFKMENSLDESELPF